MSSALWLRDLSEIIQKFHHSDDSTNPFRRINSQEILSLQAQGNSSTNWSLIYVPKTNGDSPAVEEDENFTFDSIHHCHFDGVIIFIGSFSSSCKISIGKGITLSSGLYQTTFTGTCFIGKDCLIRNNQCLNNVFIAHQAAVIGCGIISCYHSSGSSHSTHLPYGHNTVISIGPSTGGRDLTLHSLETFHDLVKKSLQPHPHHSSISSPASFSANSSDRSQFNELISSLSLTVIGYHASITQCDEILNCIIGPYAQISQTKTLSDSTIHSSRFHPVLIKRASELKRVIMAPHTTAGDECRVRDVQMFEHSAISGGALVEECVLAPDASVGGGECLHSLVGPHIGFHHNCLLISSVWPFGRGNLSYGCKVGANHTGRVSDQEHHPGEGCFFGLGVEIKFPSNTLYSPYSLFASGVTCLPQLLTFPFSLISAPDSCGCQLNLSPALNSLKPAWVLYGNPYMLFRATQKFLKRRKAEHHATDFPVMRQSIVEMMMRAREDLKTLLSNHLPPAPAPSAASPPALAEAPEVSPLCEVSASGVCGKASHQKQQGQKEKPQHKVFTEKDLRGIGKNILTHSDALKGYHAYDEAIKLFVLEKGLFEYLRARRRYDQSQHSNNGQDSGVATYTSLATVIQEILCFVDSKARHPSSSLLSHSFSSLHAPAPVLSSLLPDLQLYDPHFASHPDNNLHLGTTAHTTDSTLGPVISKQTAWALSHFLREFPHAFTLPLPLPSSVDHPHPSSGPSLAPIASGDASGDLSTVPSIDSSAELSSVSRKLLFESYLSYLLSLHQKQYETAQRCRGSDSVRGAKIIPDYEEVHGSLDRDEVLIALEGEMQILRADLTNLLNETVE